MLERITPQVLRETLVAIRHARSLSTSPLLALACVEERGRRLGCRENGARTWILETLLQSLAREAIQIRCKAIGIAAPPLDADLEHVSNALFRSADAELEAWASLLLRYLHPDKPAVSRIAEAAGLAPSTLDRRRRLGYRLLAERMRRAELEAWKVRAGWDETSDRTRFASGAGRIVEVRRAMVPGSPGRIELRFTLALDATPKDRASEQAGDGALTQRLMEFVEQLGLEPDVASNPSSAEPIPTAPAGQCEPTKETQTTIGHVD